MQPKTEPNNFKLMYSIIHYYIYTPCGTRAADECLGDCSICEATNGNNKWGRRLTSGWYDGINQKKQQSNIKYKPFN